MADVTYADLQFVSYAKKLKCPEPQKAGSEQEDEGGEITYENVQGPRIKESKATPEAARTGKEGFSVLRTWAPYIVLILLVACISLLAATIVLGVKFMQVSQQMSQDYETLKTNFSDDVRLEKSKLYKTELKLEDVSRKYRETDDMLMKAKKEFNAAMKTTEEEKERLNSEIERMKEELDKWTLIECCPKTWEMISGKCFFFSQSSSSWDESKNDCDTKKSDLLTFKNENAEVQHLIKREFSKHWNYPYTWHDGSKRFSAESPTGAAAGIRSTERRHKDIIFRP
ncbi:B-cell differentiation antigen CD72 isoform X2 [Microcaecilia unicolor]|uniref:B-cell differentiation antigen CD72-like isoform X2 n=1 Tax=Microcaecilia unicolor TaxID=1415580 RepID=A0A6P7X2T9_9AMPH|nr:B-cell differentiation antigen CD72-like isoform X2 [Microcaecilia unicolor]